MPRISTAIGSLLLAFACSTASAAPYAEGPKKCQECHEAEYAVWEDTQHAKSYKTLHKTDAADVILAAVGDKRMKKSETCQLCHYTMIQKDAGAKAKAKAGISCESCHGASSQWRHVHNNFGSGNAKDETTEHKTQRQQAARDAGMIWSFMHYDIASNFNTCHGLAHPGLDGAVLATMLDAGHPINPEFELVAYSQGQVRHRFYPPDISGNDRSATRTILCCRPGRQVSVRYQGHGKVRPRGVQGRAAGPCRQGV